MSEEEKEHETKESPKMHTERDTAGSNKEVAGTSRPEAEPSTDNMQSETPDLRNADKLASALSAEKKTDREDAIKVIKDKDLRENRGPSEAVKQDEKNITDINGMETLETPVKNNIQVAQIIKETTTHEAVAEIDVENAEDAEDHENKKRHTIALLDYHDMSMENLVGELQRLLSVEKIQAIKKHADGIKNEFDQKFTKFLDGKKNEFIASGGNEIDFRYNSVIKKQFNEVYSDYRERRNQYYKSLESTLKDNLAKRLAIIDELRGLISVEEDMNTTYNTFKELQQRWHEAGTIPRNQYNDVWRTYQHHVEMFYDFLHLNRELRDLDFKHNLVEKTKLIARAEALAEDKDLGRAFRELQELHKIWKEEIGPVAREQRDQIWNRFSNATKALHSRRQEHQKELDKKYEENLTHKNEIIARIDLIGQNVSSEHKKLQQQIKEIASLREQFFKAGKVPQRANENTWKAFKEAVRNFNYHKNIYYKSLKKEQQQNLDKKKSLVALAISLKDSEEWDSATEEYKRIQNDWKKIGHVPRKYSDAIWKEFKNACNHYFDRVHALKNSAQKEEVANLNKKTASLEKLRSWEPSGDKEKDVATIKATIAEWKNHGRVPFKQKHIDQKFNKVLDGIFKRIGVDRQESELLRYGNKIQQLALAEDQGRALDNERQFIRKKIGESKNEILQLENNLQFFKHASEDNPMVKEVINNIERHKTSLDTWKGKLKKLNIMEHNLNKATEKENQADTVTSEDE